jgi:hypothetical protein
VLAFAAVLVAYVAPALASREHYWEVLWFPPVAPYGILVVPLALGGAAVAIRGLIRGRRAGAPGDDLWYVAAALLGVPYVLMLLVYAVIALTFLFFVITCRTNCSII